VKETKGCRPARVASVMHCCKCCWFIYYRQIGQVDICDAYLEVETGDAVVIVDVGEYLKLKAQRIRVCVNPSVQKVCFSYIS